MPATVELERQMTLEDRFLESRDKKFAKVGDDEKLRWIFTIVDENRDGTISLPELKHGFAKMGIPLTEARINQMFALADRDKRGCIPYENFAMFFKALPKMIETSNIIPRDITEKRISEVPVAEMPPRRRSFRHSGSSSMVMGSARAGSRSVSPPHKTSSPHLAPAKNELDWNENRKALWALFEGMDTNESGTIEIEELKQGLRAVGCNLLEVRLVELFKVADRDKNGKIEFDEFCSFFKYLPNVAMMMQQERMKRGKVDANVEKSASIARRNSQVRNSPQP